MAPHRSATPSIYSVAESNDRLSLSLPNVNERSDFLTIRTGRKMYKAIKRSSDTITDSKQLVWPPFIEEALFQGLRRYYPPPSPNSKRTAFQRFPMRNKLISEFIRLETGEKRTAKQVGSRLQQLGQTCNVPWVQYLIGNKDFSSSRSKGLTRAMSTSKSCHPTKNRRASKLTRTSGKTPLDAPPSCSSTSTPMFISTTPIAPLLPSIFFVSLSLEESYSAPLSFSAFTLDLDESGMCYLPNPSSSSTFSRHVRLEIPGPVNQYSPFVNFSSTRLAANSQYLCVSSLYKDKELVETDSSHPNYLQKVEPQSSTVSTTINPRYWAAIVCDQEPQRYTIVHDIFVATELDSEPAHPKFKVQYTIDGVSVLPHNISLPESGAFVKDFGQWNSDLGYTPEIIATSNYLEPSSYTCSYLPHPASFYDQSFDASPLAPAYADFESDHYTTPYLAY